MKTIQEIKDAKLKLESEISRLIVNFERENKVEISHMILSRNGIKSEAGVSIDNIIEITAIIEF